jgi:hypothetical protein
VGTTVTFDSSGLTILTAQQVNGGASAIDIPTGDSVPAWPVLLVADQPNSEPLYGPEYGITGPAFYSDVSTGDTCILEPVGNKLNYLFANPTSGTLPDGRQWAVNVFVSACGIDISQESSYTLEIGEDKFYPLP